MVKRRTQIKGRAPQQNIVCAACAEVMPSWAAAERHRDATRHGRFEVLKGSP